jgi:4-hydroxybutyrate dehydrogenase/sulfolactaldehyde 3-reductase
MGKSMAANLVAKGIGLSVFDLRPEPVAELAALGAKAARSVADVVAASDVVLTMVPGSPEVEALVLAPGGIAHIGRPGMVVLDMSTVEPTSTDRMAAALSARGMSLVDAPVGRLASHADRGECLFMVGAAEADFQRVKPLLAAMGTTIHHCGSVGSGIRTKLVNNFLAIVSCQMNAEVLTLAKAFGLDLETTLDVIHGTTATNGQLKLNYASKVLAGDIEPGFTIDLAHKDLLLIVGAANALAVSVPIAAAAREALSLARSTPFHAKDFSALLDHWTSRSGLDPVRFKAQRKG